MDYTLKIEGYLNGSEWVALLEGTAKRLDWTCKPTVEEWGYAQNEYSGSEKNIKKLFLTNVIREPLRVTMHLRSKNTDYRTKEPIPLSLEDRNVFDTLTLTSDTRAVKEMDEFSKALYKELVEHF